MSKIYKIIIKTIVLQNRFAKIKNTHKKVKYEIHQL
jgi:hypothetical protein